ncbi:receptor-like protein EIX2 [Cornus florida]|uniref:receptor-like protein EIX2 n=1 Tax=Cornus florida TaxID=4283 RepID=UPI002897E0CF|nr:receptor-like protein EIX2 [Cornus florida]
MIMAKSITDVSINLAIVFLITSVVLTFDTIVVFCSGNNSSHHVVCVENERRALLKFKQDLSDPSNRLFSWVADQSGGDCCEWVGVVCNNLTGNVQELHLRNRFNDIENSLGGKLNPSLLDLKHLTHLDISGNYFLGIQIPSFIGSLGRLRYLNLSYSVFEGVIPSQLGNLSGLHFLDLDGGFEGVIPHQLGNLSNLHYLRLGGWYDGNLYANTLQWISGSSLLQHLHLENVNLSKAHDWLQQINMLPSLVELHLVYCGIHHFPPLHILNFTSLAVLDLRGDLEGVIPHQLGNLSNLHYLRLGGNLYAHTLEWISGSSLLQHLYLESVNLSKAHDWLQQINMLPSLVELHLVYCGIHHFPPLHILNFTSLAVLDLSFNRFESIPPFRLRNITSLRYLDLSCNLFNSTTPDWLSSFSRLEYLDLSSNLFNSAIPEWLSNFSLLKHLDLSFNLFNSTIPEWLSNFSHLEYLDLSWNFFTGGLPRSFENLCNLKVLKLQMLNWQLGLASVELGGDILEISKILSSCILDEIETLDLSYNKLRGHFPELGRSKKLVSLDLSHNSLSGELPVSLGRLHSLKNVYLYNNNLSGPLPESLGQLAHLENFHVSQNSLQGIISEVHFANLTRLRYLDGSGNQLFLSVSPNWVPPFQLWELSFRSCRLGPQFPHWLHSQKNLEILDISHTGISDTIPRWFWNLSSHIFYLNISHNHIHGEIVDEFLATSVPFSAIDLSSNHFNGTLPRMSSNISTLDLSNNSFSGSIRQFLCYKMDESKNLQLLNLERNRLSRELPNCWTSWNSLEFINLVNNNLSGKIPSSMGSLDFLESLHLRNNSLSGELPLSLQNCTRLVAIDFGENEFSGSIPTWIGERLSNLKILILRSNKFQSYIPKKLCALSSLQILDLAHNNFSGSIPACLMNLSAMAIQQNSSQQMSYQPNSTRYYFEGFLENALLVIKGQMTGYSTILQLVTSMDFSNNNLSGEIPEELTSLRGLHSLNLSYNLLIGRIPKNIGAMEQLEAIDFSMNHLFGEIPPSMSSLTFLSHLNLSYNNLSGKIPSSTQLQSFDAFSYVGNSLCGPPVNNNCGVNDTPSAIENGADKTGHRFAVDWFYVSMALGFVVGFWGVVGPFLFNKSWRFVCFQFMDNIWYRFHSVICSRG